MITVCVPVLRRYDLLKGLLASLDKSTTVPKRVVVLNNGRDAAAVKQAIEHVDRCKTQIDVFTPHVPKGVAESWNWFIKNVPDDDRIISNDDVLFAPASLKRLTAPEGDLLWAKGCGFSCFVIRNSCVEKLGLFDEAISPGYGYYEDEDYLQRLDGRGTRTPSAISLEVECDVVHLHSQTLKASTHEELLEHHRKFKVAQANYIKKWHLEETFA